jgi:hypothetical protein
MANKMERWDRLDPNLASFAFMTTAAGELDRKGMFVIEDGRIGRTSAIRTPDELLEAAGGSEAPVLTRTGGAQVLRGIRGPASTLTRGVPDIARGPLSLPLGAHTVVGPRRELG